MRVPTALASNAVSFLDPLIIIKAKGIELTEGP